MLTIGASLRNSLPFLSRQLLNQNGQKISAKMLSGRSVALGLGTGVVAGGLSALTLRSVGIADDRLDLVDAANERMKHGIDRATDVAKKSLQQFDEITGTPAQPKYSNAGMGFVLGALLGTASAVGGYLLRKSLAAGCFALGILGLIQVAVGLWVNYKGWVTFHWEKILDDGQLYSKTKFERAKSAFIAHLPLRAGFCTGFGFTLILGSAFLTSRQRNTYSPI